MERRDIEKWVINFLKISGKELIIITTEYDKFDKTREGLDLLAINKNGEFEYLKFYQELVSAFKEKISIPLPKPHSIFYYQILIWISGLHFGSAFHRHPRSSFVVELHFENGNKDTNGILLKETKKLKNGNEKETGEKVIFQED